MRDHRPLREASRRKRTASRLQRRQFLQLLALGAAAAACRLRPAGPEPTATSAPEPAAGTQAPTATFNPFPGTTQEPASEAPETSPSPEANSETEPAPTETDAPELPSPRFVIDAHQDIAWNALEFGRDPLKSAAETRILEAGTSLVATVGERTTGLPDYLAGRVGIIFASLFVMPSAQAYASWRRMTYSNPKQAEARAREQIDYYHELARREPRLRLLLAKKDLEAVVTGWTRPGVGQAPQVGLLIGMEGAEAIRTPQDLPDWVQAGLRLVGPAWGATRYAGGTGAPGPLTALGRQLLTAMAEHNLILDLAHLAQAAALEAVDTYAGPVIASHSNPRAFLPTDRGLSPELIQKLAGRDGVIGIMPYSRYLNPHWRRGGSPGLVTVDTVVEAIDSVVQLLGEPRHVGLGSDFDGGFGRDSLPEGMDTSADLLKIASALAGRGYSAADIEAIMNGNWLRVLDRVFVDSSIQ